MIDAVIMPSIDQTRMNNAMDAIIAQHTEHIIASQDVSVPEQRAVNKYRVSAKSKHVSAAQLIGDLIVVPAVIASSLTVCGVALVRARRSQLFARLRSCLATKVRSQSRSDS